MKTMYTACEWCGQVLPEHVYRSPYADRQGIHRANNEPEATMLRVFGRIWGFCTISHRDEWLAARSDRFKKPPDEDKEDD